MVQALALTLVMERDAGSPVAADQSPKPAFIARGPFGDSPFALTDDKGKALAYAPADPGNRQPAALSACPGGTHLIDGLTIRRVSDLAQVGTLGDVKAPGQVRCVAPTGGRPSASRATGSLPAAS